MSLHRNDKLLQQIISDMLFLITTADFYNLRCHIQKKQLIRQATEGQNLLSTFLKTAWLETVIQWLDKKVPQFTWT